MTTRTRMTPAARERHEGASARGVICPRCKGSVDRIRRQLVDRVISMFTPVYRYRCWSDNCRWEGNLRSRPG